MPNPKPEYQCRSIGRTSGERCKRYAIKGGTVCRYHGGSAPQVKAKADQRVAEAKAEKALKEKLGRLDIKPVDSYLDELDRLAGEAVAWKDLIAAHVAELNHLRYSGEAGEHIRGEVILFERALDRCVTVLATIAKLNVDERLAKVEEAKVQMVADALDVVLKRMGLSTEQRQEARRGLGAQLRLVAS